MAVASNPLLQNGSGIGSATGVNALAGNSSAKPASFTNDAGQSFSQVYASQQPAVAFKRPDVSPKSGGHAFDAPDNKPSAADNAAGGKGQVAAGGKDLPAKANDKANDNANDKASSNDKAGPASKADGSAKASSKGKANAADDSDAESDEDDIATSDDEVKAPLAALPDPTQPQPPVPAQPEPQAVVPAPLVQPQPAVQAASADDGSDSGPPGDALADLPMVRMALEHNAKANGTTSTHALQDDSKTQGSSATSGQSFSEVVDNLAQGKGAEQGATQGDASELGAALDEKHPGAAGSERSPRLEDFASRLQTLTTPAVSDTAKAQASAAAQPLQMQQSGWTEGLVNRVMYLSSQNLKSADIKLNPLELGRLDIRVDVTADQQTQVTFSSAHVAVREALENQQGRLRDMLAQQGLNNVDVNVADQSRQQQQQQQQQQQAQASQRGQAGSGRGNGGGGAEGDEDSVDAIEAPAAQTVVGSSLVDYYA